MGDGQAPLGFAAGSIKTPPRRHEPPDRPRMSTKAVISIAEVPGTLRAGTPVRLAGAR
jgi:hypothetical protein